MLGADTVYERFDEERYGAILAYHQTILAPPCGCLNHLVRLAHQPLCLPHRTTRFIYDFISYPFGLYTTTVISGIVRSNASLNITFGWSVVIKCVLIHEIEPQWSDPPIPACFLCRDNRWRIRRRLSWSQVQPDSRATPPIYFRIYLVWPLLDAQAARWSFRRHVWDLFDFRPVWGAWSLARPRV